MHEMALAKEIVDQVLKTAKSNQAKRVLKIELTVGLASGVEIEALQTAMKSAIKNTFMKSATVKYQPEPALLQCTGCGYIFKPQDDLEIYSLCPKCSLFSTVIKGKELQIKSIDIES